MTESDSTLIDLSTEPSFALGPHLVRPSTREIVAGDQRITLEPRVMQVLVALAQQRGETVSRDRLIARCCGGVVVGEDSIQRCIGRLRKVADATSAISAQSRPSARSILAASSGVANMRWPA